MRIALIAAVAAITFTGAAQAKDMKACSADWKIAKESGTPLKHNDFMASCLKGGTSVAQTVATKPAHGPTITKTVAAPMMAKPAGAPANATAKCRDGSWSTSKTHSGSCSHHGGVASFLQ